MKTASRAIAFTFLTLLPVTACHAQDKVSAHLPTEKLVIADPKGGNAHSFTVEVATKTADQMHGLMDRTSLPGDGGMLFVFATVDEENFWMKDTLIPLDMIFIMTDGHISHIHENARPQDLTSIPSLGPVKAVLEVAGGTVAKLGIKEGDTVRDKTFK